MRRMPARLRQPADTMLVLLSPLLLPPFLLAALLGLLMPRIELINCTMWDGAGGSAGGFCLCLFGSLLLHLRQHQSTEQNAVRWRWLLACA